MPLCRPTSNDGCNRHSSEGERGSRSGAAAGTSASLPIGAKSACVCSSFRPCRFALCSLQPKEKSRRQCLRTVWPQVDAEAKLQHLRNTHCPRRSRGAVFGQVPKHVVHVDRRDRGRSEPAFRMSSSSARASDESYHTRRQVSEAADQSSAPLASLLHGASSPNALEANRSGSMQAAARTCERQERTAITGSVIDDRPGGQTHV